MRRSLVIGFIFLVSFLVVQESAGSAAQLFLKLERSDSLIFSREFYKGLKEKALGNMDAALEHFSKCAELNPSNDAAWYEMGLISYGKGAYQEALTYLDRAIAHNQEQVWYFGLKADILQKEKRYEEALAVLERLIELQPGQIDHYFNRANILMALSRPQEALEAYAEIENAIGPSPELSLEKQRAYLKSGELDKAIREIEELIRQYPEEARFYLIRGELYDADHQSRKALESYKKVLKLEPENGYARLALADHYRTKGQDANSFEELKMAFQSADLSMDTKIRILLNNYLKPEKKDPDWAQAEALSKLLTAAHPADARPYAVSGDILLSQEKYREARDAYREAVKYEQNVLLLWDQLLRLEISLDDAAGMKSTSEEALRYFPGHAEFYLFNGVSRVQLGEFREAIPVLRKGLDLAKEKSLKVQFYSSLGDAYHAVGNHEASDRAFEAALRLDQENSLIMNNYAYYLAQREQHLDKAQQMSRQSIALEPENVSYHDTYAWVLYKAGNYSEARKWIEKAVDSFPNSPTFLEHYGDILFRMGEKDAAVEMWNKARELGGKSGLLDKKIREKQLYE